MMNLKYSVNTARNATSKNPMFRLRDDSRAITELYIKETNENASPNFEGKALTPKNFGGIKNILNSTKNAEKKTKSINFDIKRKVLNVFNQQKNENLQKANIDKVKISSKNIGVIQSYAAITTEGYIR
jgi:hypothetical protein